MITTQYINLNMIPSGVLPILYCSQYDVGRPLGIIVYNGSGPVDLDSYAVTIEATRTDKTPITAAVTTDGNIGAFVTTATMTNKADKYPAKLVLSDSQSHRVASLAFIMCVTPKTMDENAESIEEDASLYQQYTGTVQTLIAALRADLSAEASARVTQDAVLQAEIDQLVAPSGSAPSAAEVTNARIGADGTTYNTLGDAIRGQVTDVKSAIDDVKDRLDNATSVYVEDGRNTSSNYYKLITALNPNKKYLLAVTVPTTQTYNLQAGTAMSASSMLDTIFSGTIEANVETNIGVYTPTGAYTYLRLSKDLSWSVKIYEVYYDLAAQVSNAITDVGNAVKLINLTAGEFAASPYNSTIGNLPTETVFRIVASYNAIDWPQDNSGSYTILTCGSADRPVQFAIYQNTGTCFTRAKGASGWTDWKTYDGVYSSGIIVNDSSVYASYDDFPVGSILRVTTNAILSDAPPGFNTIGHTTTDTGRINCVVMTYTPTAANPTYICQLCQIYRASAEGKPRIAYRTAVTVSGNKVWSDWSVLSEDGVLHATNKVVDIDSYAQVTFSDFDDAPINTIYQVDYNVGNTILHNPAPGKSGILITYAFSVSTRHGLVQMHFAFETPKAVMYFRYGFEQSASQYVWTPWEKCVTETQE